MLPLPKDLPLLTGEGDFACEVVKKISSGMLSDEQCLSQLSKVCPVRVKFKGLVTKRVRRKQVTDTEHTFTSIFLSNDGVLAFGTRRCPRTGYRFPSTVSMIESYEPVLTSRSGPRSVEFKSYKEFRRRFDTRFISEEEIKKLWNSKSAQHGGKYNRNDFKKLSPNGKRLMERFLRNFKDINNGGGTGYIHRKWDDGTEYDILYEHTPSYSGKGRDLSISHQTNCPFIHYSLEYPGCGNGRYGIIANESTYLWLEDD